MKIVVASDSFKGSLSSREVGEAVRTGVQSVQSDAEVEIFSVADGGEGSLEALVSSSDAFQKVEVETKDLLGRRLTSFYLLKDDTAYIESAQFLGIDLIHPTEQTMDRATSFPLGEVMLHAKEVSFVKEIVIFLGGVGVSDGGVGCLQALGVEFYDETSRAIPTGKNALFEEISSIHGLETVISSWRDVEILVASDVEATYTGENSAVSLFATQKGASEPQKVKMTTTMEKLESLFQGATGVRLSKCKGTGAAGGCSGVLYLIGGKISSGFKVLAKENGLEKSIATCNLIFTGEGSLDQQTQFGKVPFQVSKIAVKYGKPVIAIAGRKEKELGKMDELLVASFSIQNELVEKSVALQKEEATQNIVEVVKNIMKVGEMNVHVFR